ncbi:glycosyltransferase [Mesorhizobium marinum]|uniref:glycosyltransferase n=1 Tax=Mesorhizobium marinum TaxID=3228790 RepID=UPI00346582A1
MSSISLVVVAPVFEDGAIASTFCRDLREALGPDVYVVLVDDGSVESEVHSSAISGAGLRGVVIHLRRNLGHQRAIATGLNYAADKMPDARVVVMDSDGEDIPATAPALLRSLADGSVDVAVAERKNRHESLLFKAFYAFYKVIFTLLCGRRITFGNFMAVTPAGARVLAAMPELWVHVASSVLLSRLRVAYAPIDRGQRYGGRSKMNFSSLVLHGVRALMVFSEDVLVRVCILCAAVAATSLALMGLAVVLKAIGFATPGWFSVALGILLLVLLQTGTLTLMTLVLSGVARVSSLAAVDYRTLIREVDEVHGQTPG